MRKQYFLLPIFLLLFYSCEDSISSFQSKNFIKFFGDGGGSNGASGVEVQGEGYIFAGYDMSNTGKKRIFAAKTDFYGNIIWTRSFISDSIQEASAIEVFDSNNLLIVGSSRASSGGHSAPFIFKLDTHGDSLWKKTMSVGYDLQINDFLVTGDNIFFVGESFEKSTTLPDTYIAKLNLTGDVVDAVSKGNITRSEVFKKVFDKTNGDLIVLGNSNLSGSIAVITINEFRPSSLYTATLYKELESQNNRELKDALYKDGYFYLLIYESIGSEKHTRVVKLNGDYSVIWETEPIPAIEGKSLAMDQWGVLFVAGEYSNQIQFVKIDSEGNAYFGDAVFKTYPGSVGQILSTADNGLLVVGSTPSAYSNMVQLIKTGSDLYLLKP